jgi:hypothetical protein
LGWQHPEYHDAGPDWYVSDALGDDVNGNGSADNPFKTINRAFQQITLINASEGMVLIDEGIYDETLSYPRSYPIPNIILRSWHENKPHLTEASIDPEEINLTFNKIVFDNAVIFGGSFLNLNGIIKVDSCELVNGFSNYETDVLEITHSQISGNLSIQEESIVNLFNNIIDSDIIINGYSGISNIINNVVLGEIHIVANAFNDYEVKILNNILYCSGSCAVGINHEYYNVNDADIRYNNIYGFTTAVQGFNPIGLNITEFEPQFADTIHKLQILLVPWMLVTTTAFPLPIPWYSVLRLTPPTDSIRITINMPLLLPPPGYWMAASGSIMRIF